MPSPSDRTPAGPRQILRRTLLSRREQFVATPQARGAASALWGHLSPLLTQLEPAVLGLYWAMRCEFNAAAPLLADRAAPDSQTAPSLALPFAQRAPVRMHYRAWDGAVPGGRDDCGLPSAQGTAVVPDVVLVPCVGYTAQGFRLGYGGGYFDRWLAEHPDVTSVGVAWSLGEISADALDVQPHDQRLTLIVTERGVV